MFGKTKRFYKEVPCEGCKGGGQAPLAIQATGILHPAYAPDSRFLMALQGICLGCSGPGTQTVLEREEV